MLQFVVGTRPEAIKIGPLVAECKRRGVSREILHTGQHTDLLVGTGLEPDTFLPALPPVPDGLSPLEAQRWTQAQLRDRLRDRLHGVVVVQGDTVSATTAAGLAHEMGLPLAHVEAGVRTYQEDPWPEEGYRVQIDRWADVGFCATDWNLANVRAEGCRGHFTVTGNPGVDALRGFGLLPGLTPSHSVVVTLHRRESFGEPMRAMAAVIAEAATTWTDLVFTVVTHPNGEVGRAFAALPSRPANLRLRPAMERVPFNHQLANAKAVITDSGGVQEDAATLGIPCVVARDHTDRPESIASGHAILGTRDPAILGAAITHALTGHLRTDPSDCFGDGQAAPQIVDGLTALLD